MITSEQMAILKIEYPRRQQIFNESVAIMQRTNNPDVLIRRYSELTDYIDWFFAQKEKGLPLKADKTKEQMNSDIPAFFNFHAVRIANYISEHSPKKDQHRLLMSILSELKASINKEEAYIEISQIINKILIGK